MTSSRKYAEIAAAALDKMLPAGIDSGQVADIVESVLADATREREEDERQHLGELEAAAAIRLSRLLDACPAVIYSFEAKGDFAPTFVSDNIMRLFGYAASEYLENPNFWRERVHPDDLPRIETEMDVLFEQGHSGDEYLKDAEFWRARVHPDDIDSVEAEQALLFEKDRHTAEYRFRKKDGQHLWVSNEQHLIRDESGEEADGFKVLLDLQKHDRAEAVAALEAILARLKG